MTLFERLNARYRTFESPLAVGGNWNGDQHTKELLLGDISKRIVDMEWKPLPEQVNLTAMKDIEFRYMKSSKRKGLINCIGGMFIERDGETRFKVMVALVLAEYEEEVYKDRDIYQTTRVQLGEVDEMKGRGLALSLYSSLIESGYLLICDSVQYDGARNLWRKLSNRYIVDVFDGLSGSVTKTHHKIIKTDIDDLDEEWSSGFSQKHENLLFTVRKDKDVQLSDKVER